MSYYTKSKFTLTSHAIKRFSQRSNFKNTSSFEIEIQIHKILENTYCGEKVKDGDFRLYCFDDSSAYFVITKDNVVKTFNKKK